MSHLDEGTLHALLDGELDLAEVSEVQSHLGTCAACGSRLQEVKQFLAESDRLVGALEMPAASAAQSRSPSRRTPPVDRGFREPEWEEPPVLLLPEDATAAVRRRRWLRAFRWAAMIAVVVGGGRLLMGVIGSHSSLPRARDITTATRTVPPAVASPEETRRPTPPAAAPTRPSRTPSQNRAPLSKTTPQSVAKTAPAVADTADKLADTSDAFADSIPAEPQTLAAGMAADSASSDSVPRDTGGAVQNTEADRQNEDLATRRAAAEALAELDRERRRERAAAATAALRPSAPAPAPTAPAEAPPPPRTPEQRAQVYLRIGLDEAVKQLGGPVHVIEGMTPELIGLTNGRLVPGADPSRPVVRVVYLDPRGRIILLDQQRLRSGQAPAAAAGSLRWTVGDVMLYLRGEPGRDILRNLQRRVR
jgi:anti-sigma factor RsiW